MAERPQPPHPNERFQRRNATSSARPTPELRTLIRTHTNNEASSPHTLPAFSAALGNDRLDRHVFRPGVRRSSMATPNLAPIPEDLSINWPVQMSLPRVLPQMATSVPASRSGMQNYSYPLRNPGAPQASSSRPPVAEPMPIPSVSGNRSRRPSLTRSYTPPVGSVLERNHGFGFHALSGNGHRGPYTLPNTAIENNTPWPLWSPTPSSYTETSRGIFAPPVRSRTAPASSPDGRATIRQVTDLPESSSPDGINPEDRSSDTHFEVPQAPQNPQVSQRPQPLPRARTQSMDQATVADEEHLFAYDPAHPSLNPTLTKDKKAREETERKEREKELKREEKSREEQEKRDKKEQKKKEKAEKSRRPRSFSGFGAGSEDGTRGVRRSWGDWGAANTSSASARALRFIRSLAFRHKAEKKDKTDKGGAENSG